MKIESLPKDIFELVNSNEKVLLYLNNLKHGRPFTPRSWLYEGKSDTEVLSLWLKELEKVKTFQYGDEVYQFDTSELKKWGAQGGVQPLDELMDILTEGFSLGDSPRPKIFASRKWEQAKANAVQHLIVDTGLFHALRPRDAMHVVDDMRDRDTLESNSGMPSFGRRKDPDILKQAIQDAVSGNWKNFPAIPLFRNYSAKTRLVWMYPMSSNIVEGMFTQPLKQALMNSKLSTEFLSPWKGYEYVLAKITRLYQNDRQYLSASDFSHTDSHFGKWVMYEVYDVIKHAFQPKYWNELKESMLHVCEIPLLLSNDKWIVGNHGVASGSNWTNDCETYLDFIAEEYFTLLGLVSAPAVAIGDDVLHTRSTYDKTFAKEIALIYRQMGFDVNEEKVTNDIHSVKYLKRWTHYSYFSGREIEIDGHKQALLRGIYSTVRALNSSLNPEKFHSPKLWSKDMFAVRQFMILENVIDHPLFHEFVKFVCKGHSYLQEFARHTDKFLNEKQRESQLIPGLNPTYNQEKRDKPLSEFESIRIARYIRL